MPNRTPTDQPGDGFPEWDIDIVAALKHLREIGAGDSAQATMLRVVWLRREMPGAVIDTEAVKIERDLVVIRAVTTLADGTAGSGFAAELTEDHPSLAIALETAETRAIGRALDVLGLILPPETEPRPKPEPIRQPERAKTQPAAAPVEPEDPPAVVDALRRAARSQPRSIHAVEQPDAEEPVARSTAGDVRFTVPTPFPQRSPSEDTGGEDGENVQMEDVSWTSFWRWARDKGMMRKVDIEQRIGRSIDELSPAEIRVALQETGIDLS